MIELIEDYKNINHKRPGRLRATGKYETREELIAAIFDLLERRKMSISSIARCCKISRSTADGIIKRTMTVSAK